MILLQVFLSAFSAAVYFVYLSSVLKTRPAISSTLSLCVSHLLGAAALLPYILSDPYQLGSVANSHNLYALSLTSVLLVLSRQLYFYAYAHTDVANITVFSALTPIYALGTGYLFFNEFPTARALVGLFTICASIYILFLKKRPGAGALASVIQPFLFIGYSKPVLCAFLSTIPTAFAAAYQKELMRHLSPALFSFALLAFIGILASLYSVYMFRRNELIRQFAAIPWHFYVVSALLLPLTHISFCYVIAYHQTAISLVLQRSSILIQIILAYYLLKERQDVTKRITVGMGIITGFFCIVGG